MSDYREPCGEGMCRCYGTGPDHADCACGCDCPRDGDGHSSTTDTPPAAALEFAAAGTPEPTTLEQTVTDPNPDRTLRATFTVTVTSRPDGGHYFDRDDFLAHVVGWLKAGLKDRHAIAEVTVAGAEPAVVPSAPVDRAAEIERLTAERDELRTAWESLARRCTEDAEALVEVGHLVGVSLGARTVSIRTAIEAIGTELRRLADEAQPFEADRDSSASPKAASKAQPTTKPEDREADPDCERCDGTGLDPDTYTVNGDVWTHARCSECFPEDDDEPAAGVRQDGAQTTPDLCPHCEHNWHGAGRCEGGSISTITGCRCTGRPQ